MEKKSIEEQVNELSATLMKIQLTQTDWPIINKKYTWSPKDIVVYPRSLFQNLQRTTGAYVWSNKKSDRIAIHTKLIDLLMNEVINTHIYYLGFFCIYTAYGRNHSSEFTEKAIGKKRSQYIDSLPQMELISDDDFLTEIWSALIEERDTHISEHKRNPWLKQVRLLFTPEQLEKVTGRLFYECDWVEPISGKLDLACKKWAGEHDPMAPLKIPEGWVEGPIMLGREGVGSGFRHFVQGVKVNAGRTIHVKFGGGWIVGRYEWAFEKGSPIQVQSGLDVINIQEGHMVRIKG